MGTEGQGREETIININILRDRVHRYDEAISDLKKIGVVVDEGDSFVGSMEFYFYNATKTEEKLFSATRIEIFIRLANAYVLGFKDGGGKI